MIHRTFIFYEDVLDNAVITAKRTQSIAGLQYTAKVNLACVVAVQRPPAVQE